MLMYLLDFVNWILCEIYQWKDYLFTLLVKSVHFFAWMDKDSKEEQNTPKMFLKMRSKNIFKFFQNE